ncbi:MAG: hypothetical protein J7M13_08975 [Synergistetes bacterium]|nr:hypothetical protein [Synergistota bacterium]
MGAVKFKGTKEGIKVIVDERAPWGNVIKELEDKLNSSFFDEGRIFLELGKRKLSREEYKLMDEVLTRKPSLRLMGVEALDLSTRAVLRDFLPKIYPDDPELAPLFHRGTLRSGTSLEYDGDVFIIGDVNPGAEVHAGRSLAVFGSLRGSAYVGKRKRDDIVVVALRLTPSLLVMGNKVVSLPEEVPRDKPALIAFSGGKLSFHLV